MRKVNTNWMPELSWASPKGKFVGAGEAGFGSTGKETVLDGTQEATRVWC